jgi:hypothetical protein
MQTFSSTLRLIAVVASAGANIAYATTVCPPSNAIGRDGIGDGCTVPLAGALFPNISAFKGTFTAACNSHDKCYTTLGASYSECNPKFLSDMRSACRSAFHPILRPVEFQLCYDTATHYFLAVEDYAQREDPMGRGGHQADALTRSRALAAQVNADVCGTTPELTTLYSASLIAQINQAFLANAARPPTIYEFFDAVNGGDIVARRSQWEALLTSTAMSAAAITPPSAAYTVSSQTAPVVLAASNAGAGASYLWALNIGRSSATNVSVPQTYPQYNYEWEVIGFLKVTNTSGWRNMQLIKAHILEPGWCATTPGSHCN